MVVSVVVSVVVAGVVESSLLVGVVVVTLLGDSVVGVETVGSTFPLAGGVTPAGVVGRPSVAFAFTSPFPSPITADEASERLHKITIKGTNRLLAIIVNFDCFFAFNYDSESPKQRSRRSFE